MDAKTFEAIRRVIPSLLDEIAKAGLTAKQAELVPDVLSAAIEKSNQRKLSSEGFLPTESFEECG